MNYILCIVNNILFYESRYINNPILHDGSTKCIPILNKNNLTPGKLYNDFLKEIPRDAERIAFVVDCIEFRSNTFSSMLGTSENALHGVFGGSIVRNGENELLLECAGRIMVRTSNKTTIYHNRAPSNGDNVKVDALDSRFMVVHANLLRSHGLRFDENLHLLYGEEFCLRAADVHSLHSYVRPFDILLHEELFYSQQTLAEDAALCAEYFAQSEARAGAQTMWANGVHFVDRIVLTDNQEREPSKIYSRTVNEDDLNLPVVIAGHMLKPGMRILDAGCATGDNGYFLSKVYGSELYGMEYDAESLELAKKHGVYTDLHRVDLNTLEPADYQSYYRYFDAILLLDVLEHLYEPIKILQKMAVFLKSGGFFIISLPNIAHAHPVIDLCNKEFTYREYGILDSTHIRFFTWKSLAKSLASSGFVVDVSSATFRAPNTSNMNATTSVPLQIVETLLEDPHSLVCQYVCCIYPSNESYAQILDKNLASLKNSPQSNPGGWRAMDNDLFYYKRKLALNFGFVHTNSEIKRLMNMIKQEKYIQAVLASGFFDEEWYRDTNADVDFSTQHPVEHYLIQGWKEGRHPSEAFDQDWYSKQLGLDLVSGNTCPLLFHLAYTLMEKVPHNPRCLKTPDTELVDFAKQLFKGEDDYPNTFVKMDSTPFVPDPADPKLVAFYLPQFSPFPENDQWWGKGFTEWTNVTKASPLFPGHYQPHLPYDLGFYDLRIRQVCLRQEELAQHYGIHGFCYHYYWFDGKKIMNTPIENKLADLEMNLPFCINWANEAWSANWDGSQNNLLIGQPPKIQTEKLFYDLLPFFKDKRYICVEGKPFFMLYRPSYFEMDVVQNFIAEFKRLAIENGFPGLHIALGKTLKLSFPLVPLHVYGADSYVEFPPHRITYERFWPYRLSNNKTKADIYDLPKLIARHKRKDEDNENMYRTVFPMWDNTARRAESGATLFVNATPEVYSSWLLWCLQKAKEGRTPGDTGMVFINAWNEWAEGAHLEPDRKYGYAFLQKTKEALYASRRNHRRS